MLFVQLLTCDNVMLLHLHLSETSASERTVATAETILILVMFVLYVYGSRTIITTHLEKVRRW